MQPSLIQITLNPACLASRLSTQQDHDSQLAQMVGD